MEDSVKKNIKEKKVHFADISIHTFPKKPDHPEKVDKTISTPPKPVRRLGLRKKLQKSSTSEQSKLGTQQNPNDMRNNKDQFFASMIPDPRPISTESEDDLVHGLISPVPLSTTHPSV